MRCPYCNSNNTRVVDSRPNENETQKRRRHECNSCNERFTTYEIYQTKYDEMLEEYVLDAVKAKKILKKIDVLLDEAMK